MLEQLRAILLLLLEKEEEEEDVLHLRFEEPLSRGFNHALAPAVSTVPDVLGRRGNLARPSQRHAEVHCLLQLDSLDEALDREMLVVELADVGPGFRWAEPCSRGCMQLLMRHGIAAALFTDGEGSVVRRRLKHRPDLDVATATFKGNGRLRGCAIAERAVLDVTAKFG
mmetsp:Transcript_41447/g.62639  ORF Transcript_41447/g.62639 Transcript_41447/m.62639 type:complete len:169 (+) Transcript_41447:254-760(+)